MPCLVFKPAKSVTLIVTSKQAEAIQLASVAGRPWLVLRGGIRLERFWIDWITECLETPTTEAPA